MKAELSALQSRGTWEIVKCPQNAIVVDSRWVFKIKKSPDGSEVKLKSRLVARGFSQQYGVNYFDTYAPVVKNSCVRLLLSVAVECEMFVEQIDIKNAYVNSDLEEVVYMQPPEGLTVDRGSVLKLNKSLYGLKQSGHQWNKCLNKVLVDKMKFKRLKSESCIYKRGAKREMIILAIYVDDIMIFAFDQSKISEIKNQIKSEFEIDDIGECRKVIGMHVNCTPGQIELHQKPMIECVLKEAGLEMCKVRATPLESGLKLERCERKEPGAECGVVDGTHYRSLLGKLNYLASTTRPDLTFAISYLSQFNQCPHVDHLGAVKSVLRYLAGTADRGIRYVKAGEPLVAYTDADWGQCVIDRRSYSGYVTRHSGGPVSWAAKKQESVADSSTVAEYMAMTYATKEIMFLRNILEELDLHAVYGGGAITMKCDNQGAMHLAMNNGYSPRTKHVAIKHHFIREAVDNHIVKLEYVDTEHNLADIFTKALKPVVHRRLAQELIVVVKE